MEEHCVKLEWDYLEGKSMVKSKFFDQIDWNQTLITKINQASATIFKASNRGGATTIEIHPFLLELIETLMYYDETKQVLGGRYNLITNDELDKSLIYLYKKPERINNVPHLPNHVKEDFIEMGRDEFKLLSINEFTTDEIKKYEKKCRAYVEIKNYNK